MNHKTSIMPSDSTAGDFAKILFAILLPPLGVALEVGLTKPFWINVLLTLLGFIPGVVHAVYVIAKH
ncbi:MAG TPA: YqaE/Pmp3 family membrane protein [Micavibrio sp.]|nr:YqaE/Pmp3 family membrane protein [Micavibrio sp.]